MFGCLVASNQLGYQSVGSVYGAHTNRGWTGGNQSRCNLQPPLPDSPRTEPPLSPLIMLAVILMVKKDRSTVTDPMQTTGRTSWPYWQGVTRPTISRPSTVVSQVVLIVDE